jgi:indole-3-glycerol phosphate synthase
MANDRYNLDTILAVKRQLLAERRAKTPIQAVIALADMQRRPQPILNTVTNGTQIALIGQITRSDTYDPVGATLNYIREGVDAVSLFTDRSVYGRGLDDLLLVSRGVNIPVITQDYILDEYHVVESRAAGASALILSSSVLDEVGLRNTVTATQRWRMTAIVQVSDEQELEYAQTLSPHVLGIGTISDAENCSHSIQLFQKLRDHIPYNMRVMVLGCMKSLEDIQTVVDLGVDAIMVSDALLDDPYQSEQLHDFLSRERPD